MHGWSMLRYIRFFLSLLIGPYIYQLRFPKCKQKMILFLFKANGQWESWVEVGECTPSCGVGKQERTRKCTGVKGNGIGCQGEGTDKITCTKDPVCGKIAIFEIYTKFMHYFPKLLKRNMINTLFTFI